MHNDTGDAITGENAAWKFSGDVPKKFEEHVNKSVPNYSQGHDLILKVSDFFMSENSVCYDLGCSTGILSAQLAKRSEKKETSIIGVDVEIDMIKFAQERDNNPKNLQFIQGNLTEFEFKKADLIVAYYTIQFVKPNVRQLVINKIYESLHWGGAFILFEKVRGADARFQDISTSLYNDYKLDQGYSADNIISKSRSLKGVLEPFSTKGNLDLLARAGFIDVMTIMKYVCFEGFLAIK